MVARSGRGWKLAPCLDTLIDEVDALAPNRNRKADGSIGDRAHSRRTSHHNPRGGYVDALDITHSPANGFDCHEAVAQVVANRDARVEYLIFDRRIWRSYKSSSRHPQPWTPQAYTGSNPHRHHMHVSVWRDSRRNNTEPWFGQEDEMPVSEDKARAVVTHAYAELFDRSPSDEERAYWVEVIRNDGTIGALFMISSLVGSRLD